MKLGKFISPLRGITAAMAAILTLSVMGYAIADTWRSNVDDMLGTETYVTNSEGVTYQSTYDTAAKMMEAAKNVSIKEGEEGTVILKNEDSDGNAVLPMTSSGQKVALFGLASYAPYPYKAGDLKGGNSDAVDLVDALTAAGFQINANLETVYNTAMNKHTEEVTNAYTGEVSTEVAYDLAPQINIGDMTTFDNNELSVSDMYSLAKTKNSSLSVTGVDASALGINKDDTIGIVTFARPGGESNTYLPKSQADYTIDSETNDYVLPSAAQAVLGANGSISYTGITSDALALSDVELGVVKTAKSLCSKVIVLLNTGNNMEISQIVSSDDYEADAIAYIGVPNDYQFTGIVDVLAGKVNATGALADTYVTSNSLSNPAMMNFGGDYYSDYTIVANENDSRWPGVSITNEISQSSFNPGTTYNGGQYVVEAEDIYVGYKYFESRYYDSIMDSSYDKDSTAGSSDGTSAWSYDNEVVYTFGSGLSYYDYKQDVTDVTVDKLSDGSIDPNGYVTAEVTVTNNSETAATFTAQLYVQQPYTDYDKNSDHLVEKSAIMFLNSAKVTVAANNSAKVNISVLTKYLASYDDEGCKTYILDPGDYYFTAAAGAHEAVNNIIYAQQTANDTTPTVDQKGAVKTWTYTTDEKETPDSTTFATENGVEVTNVADDADLNYWIPNTVTYLSRTDWAGTYPKNYNTDVTVTLANSTKKDEWVKQLRNETYTIDNTGEEVENVDGQDNGYAFNAEQLTDEVCADINNEYWDNLVNQLSVNVAVGAILHGGSASDPLDIVESPRVVQNEGVNGFTTGYYDADTNTTYYFNISSQTLLGSSFDPDLALEWGKVEGNSGLWLQRYDVWGTGLTQRRTPYNGRNYEYISEDPMLANIMGYGIIKGNLEFGILVGPKHLGFNDQEHNRNGVSVYITEQKMRETDLRCFQGALEDAHGLAIMIGFNRIGAITDCQHEGMIQGILRGEWNYEGLISTDMCTNMYYMDGASMIMAGITQVADFTQNDSYISQYNNHNGTDASWPYITVNNIKNDATLVNQARTNIKYQLFAFANSAIRGITTERVTPWWESAFTAVTVVSAILMALAALGWVACVVVPKFITKEED